MKLKSAIKRAAVAMSAPARRALIKRHVSEQANKKGISPEKLERFFGYISVSLGLASPAHTEALQTPRHYYPGLSAKPVHDTSAFSWTAGFRARFDVIREEMLTQAASGSLELHPGALTDAGRWERVDFFKDGGPSPAASACPATWALLETVPGVGQAGNAYISVLQPHTHIAHHVGSTNVRIRCHLGLITPPSARMRVGDQHVTWREGEFLIFDDSFDHEVWDEAGSERIVLLFDTRHPELTGEERWAIDLARRLGWGLRDIGPVQRAQLGVR